MKELLKQTIEGYKTKKLILQDEIKQFVQNKLLPLSDRWEIFCLAGNEDILPKRKSIQRFKDEDLIEWFEETSHFVRFEVITAVAFTDALYYENEHLVNIAKEEWIDKFIWSFELDW